MRRKEGEDALRAILKIAEGRRHSFEADGIGGLEGALDEIRALAEKALAVEAEPEAKEAPKKAGPVVHSFVCEGKLTGYCECGWPGPEIEQMFEGRAYRTRPQVLRRAWNMHARAAKKKGEKVIG